MHDQNTVEILLVEDNPDDAEMALRAFKQTKIANSIVHVKNGQEALDYIYAKGVYEGKHTLTPKIILLDLNLPKVNGIEVIRRLKSDPATKIIPIVVLSSSLEEIDLHKSYQLGANSYLVKPIDFEKFCEAIKELGIYWLLLNKLPEHKNEKGIS